MSHERVRVRVGPPPSLSLTLDGGPHDKWWHHSTNPESRLLNSYEGSMSLAPPDLLLLELCHARRWCEEGERKILTFECCDQGDASTWVVDREVKSMGDRPLDCGFE